jgi:hypothetical protein
MPIAGYAVDINIMGRSMQTVEKMHTEFEEQTETIRHKLTHAPPISFFSTYHPNSIG